MTFPPITSDAAQAAERVRAVLAAAGFPAARVAAAQTSGVRPIAVAGYVVEEGLGGGPHVWWSQRLANAALEAKLEEVREALCAAGLPAQWVEKSWELEVQA